MDKPVHVIQVGCGPIGCRMIAAATERASLSVVGAVDVDSAKIGKDLGEIGAVGRRLGVNVSGSLASAIEDAGIRSRPVVAVHCTGSRIEAVAPQIIELVEHGLNVVSTCEEFVYPFRDHPAAAERIDQAARANDVSVLGTGINPGFLMDTWPLAMTAVCTRVDAIEVVRVQDASHRREPFQQKIGAGLTTQEFSDRAKSGEFGHVGLRESLSMLAAGLGWRVGDISETLEPVILDHRVKSEAVDVPPGYTAGLRQTAAATVDSRTVLALDFQAYIGASESFDEVRIEGTPPMSIRVVEGTHGDVGTVAVVMNAIPKVVEARAGLLTMIDLPVVHFRSPSL